MHLKRNVPSGAKRGVSDFLPVMDELRQELRLSRNLASGAALQAALADEPDPWFEGEKARIDQRQFISIVPMAT